MTSLFQIFIILYTCFTAWCVVGTWRFFRRSEKIKKHTNIPLDNLSVIIPFRDEESRITPLLECIHKYLPESVELLFVDDHSEDDSCKIITNILPNATILKNKKVGKKHALATAINHTKREWILTWDADICFSENYFNQLEMLNQADLLILPIRFTGNLLQKFIQFDTELAQITNYAQAGFGNPILSSGANLLFRKTSYLEKHHLTSHQHIASGDDQFLLQSIIKNGGSVQLISDPQLVVTTPCETNLITIIHQRLRWLTKTPSIKDKKSNTIAFTQFFLHLFWGSLLVVGLFGKNHSFVLMLYSSKTVLDFLICLRFFIHRKEFFYLLLLPFIELYFPLYSIFIALSALFIQPKWKNRTLKT